jgi:hypothetical protein
MLLRFARSAINTLTSLGTNAKPGAAADGAGAFFPSCEAFSAANVTVATATAMATNTTLLTSMLVFLQQK